MEFHVIGTMISVALVLFSGTVLMMGINFFEREKSAGSMRYLLLFYSITAFGWAFWYGIIGFITDITVAEYIRMVGVLNINLFLYIDFCILIQISKLKPKVITIAKWIFAVVMLADFVSFSRPGVDDFVIVNGYTTWMIEPSPVRQFHNIVVIVMAVVMATLGVHAYRKYRYKRQKAFMTVFYVANLVMLAGTSLDTFSASEYALPTSGFGALFCTVIIWAGTFRYSAFDVSVADIFDQIYNFVNAGIIILNDEQEIMHANPYACTIIEDSDYEDRKLTDLFDVVDEDTAQHQREDGENFKENFHLKAKNTKIECDAKFSHIEDRYGQSYGYILVLYDITKEINMLEELRKANAAKDHFLTSMSHEIRTPINSVLGMNEMILRKSSEADILRYATDIDRSGRLLLSLINDILDFSKLESGKFDLLEGNYELSSTIHDLYVVVAQKAKEKNIRFDVKVNPDIPSGLYGDEIRIKQIVINLLNNAIKYTDDGFVCWECDYEKNGEDNIRLVISVRDSGRGMKNHDMDVLFQDFTRLDERKNRNIEGTGLGLSIVKSLLEIMGGEVEVESVYGVGSRFTVFIPQIISDATPIGDYEQRIGSINSDKNEYRQSFIAPTAKILAVDDVDMNLVVIKELLADTKIQIDAVNSGREALAKCKTEKYDLLLLDHMMPEMDGIECLKRIRQESNVNIETPAAVLTANAVAGMKEMYIEEGFNDYLSKPIEGVKLEKMIIKYIPQEKVE